MRNFSDDATFQNCLSLRVVKKVILWKTDFRDIWIRFLLNEALFADESKIILINLELIKMILLRVESGTE
jgi:hypothetical protein